MPAHACIRKCMLDVDSLSLTEYGFVVTNNLLFASQTLSQKMIIKLGF